MELVLGILIGCVATVAVLKIMAVGTLRVDTSDPDGPYLFLELSKDVGPISARKYVILEVNTKSYISQK